MVTAVLFMFLMVFGLPIAAGLLLRPKTTIGGRSSFSRWWSANRDRTAAAREIARRHRLRYVDDTLEGRNRVAHFFYFRDGNRGTIGDLVIGESEARVEALFSSHDMRWTSTLAHFTSPDLVLPVFHLGARDFSFKDRTAPEINFGDVPEFSAAFEVRGENEAEVRALLDRRVRTELAGVGSLWIEGKASELLCVSALDYTLLSEREEFLRLTRKICSILTVRDAA